MSDLCFVHLFSAAADQGGNFDAGALRNAERKMQYSVDLAHALCPVQFGQ